MQSGGIRRMRTKAMHGDVASSFVGFMPTVVQDSVDEQLVDEKEEAPESCMLTMLTSTFEKQWAAMILSGSSCSSLPSTVKARFAVIFAKPLTIVEAAIPTAYDDPVSTTTSK
mmetsp:Transcript_22495/g.42272  ORF Transcript_22495/g.42272 Transcript_22495/m.42272 type:complete len:113 (+) Transcript_22495:160-498(+)|eukprot:CAMPEP_0170191006 /NCGR_PEP_ID=MMETSP0040_2-20121228/50654_1 /TAXON_ID=641309 /ORGANISM="Lotharella oceanica, Strain CCMP622" /LENGTH=112 /DNA_ID=CAMNT_0010438995 /DNA_START=139 /DNA_END=477 /DNA_ORIENTATION=-